MSTEPRRMIPAPDKRRLPEAFVHHKHKELDSERTLDLELDIDL